MNPVIAAEEITAYYGTSRAIEDVSLVFAPRAVTSIIGPSGCGKSTLLRCLNRIHETAPHARVEGKVLLDGSNVYEGDVDPVEVRRKVGMVFQRANPFPTMSILDNVVSGLRYSGRLGEQREKFDVAERVLRMAALWEEVKDALGASAMTLSGGQQQRLCIARALAMGPEVLLMDEPTSALDPISTLQLEELISHLATKFTMIVVTHNMQQAARISQYAAFMLAEEASPGRLIECGETTQLFTRPTDKRTEDYITGRFG